jgi:hypothetical protein
VSIRIYVEGGGSSKTLRTACRKGFRSFIENAGISCRENGIQPVACGPEHDAYDSFTTAHSTGEGHPMLLVDSDEPVTAGPWEHLYAKRRWRRPAGSSDEQCHLMVQVMESWFLADRGRLASYYGHAFNANVLPANPDIERVPKQDVLRGLRRATRDTQKGAYSKGQHSFEILAGLDPVPVAAASPHARRLLDALRAESSA